jgi:hypothetical protein
MKAGRQAGAVNRVEVSVEYRPPENQRTFSIYPHAKDDGAIFIEPGQTTGVSFLFKDAQFYGAPQTAKNHIQSPGGDVARPLLKGAKCQVWVRGVNSESTTFHMHLEIVCQDQAFQMFRRLLADSGDRTVPGQ